MAPTQPDFVRAVLDRLGITQTDLGRLLRYPQPYQDAHRLLVGGRNLSYDDTMTLLEKCGWLSMGEAVPLTAAADPLTARLEHIAAVLKSLALNQAAGLEALGVPADVRVPIPLDEQPRRARPKRK